MTGNPLNTDVVALPPSVSAFAIRRMNVWLASRDASGNSSDTSSGLCWFGPHGAGVSRVTNHVQELIGAFALGIDSETL